VLAVIYNDPVADNKAVREGDGSRVVLELSGTREYAHRPHPGKEAKKYMVEKIREWLTGLEVTP